MSGDGEISTDGPTLPTARSREGVLTAVLVGVVGVAGSYAIAANTPSFVVVPVNSLVVDLMPARVLRFSIIVLGEVGDLVGIALSLSISILALGVVALAGFAVGERLHDPAAPVAVVYFGGWGLTAALTGKPFVSLATAVPMGTFVGLLVLATRRRRRSETVDDSRRLVVRLVATLGFTGLAGLLGHSSVSQPTRLSTIPSAEQATIKDHLALAHQRSFDIPGLPGLVSPLTGFYKVDIDTVVNPRVGVGDWTLSVTGAVTTERTLSYADLTNMDPNHRFVTLRCVNDPVDGDLVNNALWTGVPVQKVLDAAGVSADATHVVLHAVDDYYEEFPLAALEKGFLAYGMNGYLLPRAHGYPVRALVPGHWGEVSVKWLREIEIRKNEASSYWEQRGWHGTGPANTVAKLEVVNDSGDGTRVAGHAYAGTRGVRTVEVSIDGGDTWNEATLSKPLPGRSVWRQWTYSYQPPSSEYEVVVRTIDGEGAVQPRQRANAFPSGATGWVSKTIRP